MKKNVDEKLDIYKITKSEELQKYYQNWTKKNNYTQDMVDLKNSFTFHNSLFESSFILLSNPYSS